MRGVLICELCSQRRKDMSMRTQVKLRMDGSAIFASKNLFFGLASWIILCTFQGGWAIWFIHSSKAVFQHAKLILQGMRCNELVFFSCWLTTNAGNPKCHFPIYEHQCREQGVLMHKWAIPAGTQASLVRYAYNLYISTTCTFLPISVPDSRLLMGLLCLIRLSSQRQAWWNILSSWLFLKIM